MNTQEFLCALRLVSNASSPSRTHSGSLRLSPPFQELLEHQSARTRCVQGTPNPQNPDALDALWDEVFVFELPPEGGASIDIVATNQGANGGRGALVGGVTVPAVESTGGDVSGRWPILEPEWFTLKTEGAENGRLSVAVHLFDLEGGHAAESGGKASFKKRRKSKVAEGGAPEGSGLQVGLEDDGPWSPLRSVIPVGAFVRTVGGMQVVVQVRLCIVRC
jgi:vacuolar protein sorting-associated protein 13A/C